MNEQEKQKINRLMNPKTFILGLLVLLIASLLSYFLLSENLRSKNRINEYPLNGYQGDAVNFSQTGALVRNMPGYKADTWYLHYQKPGQPGLYAELVIAERSICNTRYSSEDILCKQQFPYSQGQVIEVRGNLNGDVLTIDRILEITPNENSLPDALTSNFQKSDVFGFYGTLTLRGYLKINTRVCNPDDMCGETVEYATFIFSESDNKTIYNLLNEFTGNAFVSEGQVGLGCYQKDKNRIYSINDADTGTIENVITGSDLSDLLSSSKVKQVKLKLTKPIYTSGRGAPDCYSHFRYFDVVNQMYINYEIGFSLEMPAGVAVDQEFNTSSNQLVIFKGNGKEFEVRVKPGQNISLENYHYLDLAAVQESILGGNKALVFKAPNGYCDGQSCTKPFLAYSAKRGDDFYNLVFYGNDKLEDYEQRILNSFQFR